MHLRLGFGLFARGIRLLCSSSATVQIPVFDRDGIVWARLIRLHEYLTDCEVQSQILEPTKPDVSTLPAETLEFAHRMFDAARSGDSAILLQAIEKGLPLNLTNDKGILISYSFHLYLTCSFLLVGNTLLMLAAYAGHTDLAKSLLSRGADPNCLNDLGQSIIAGAVFKAHDDVVHALMEKGADPRLGTPNAIQTAYMFGRTELMEVLGMKEDDVGAEVPTPPSMLKEST